MNHLFSSQKRFNYFLLEHNIDSSKEYFIQVFIGNNSPNSLEKILKNIQVKLPLASTIATSTAGEIIEGGMFDNTTVISITSFESTKVKVELIESSVTKDISNKIASLTTSKTKLILAFNNVYENDAEEILFDLEKKLPYIKVAGGNAGDNEEFSNQTVVGVNTQVSTTGIAVAIFDSDILNVFNDYVFNWQTLGETMTVTKSDKSIIYEINDTKATDVYKYFLGEDVSNNLPLSGVEFPLIFKEDGIDIARAPVATGNEGSLIMAGHIKEGTKVKFGFGDVSEIDKNVTNTIEKFANNPIESIFIYSCSARKYFLQDHLNSEFEMLQQIAPTSGFITYGEFFKQKECNKLLNVSSTFIGLSEKKINKNNIKFNAKYTSKNTRTLNALTHLIKQTSRQIEEKNYNLNQFQNLIKDSTLYSTTDLKGVITDVNEKFINLSGYTRDELIGSAHSIVRHPDMPSSIYKDMWDTIKRKKIWNGIIKNLNKNGSAYYVRSSIFPILTIEGSISKYISIRDDITEEIKKQELLEGTVDLLDKEAKNKEYLLDQYEKIINVSSAFFRMDREYNITYVNDVFCKIYRCPKDRIKTKTIFDILEDNFIESSFESINSNILKNGIWTGVVPFQRLDKSIIYMDTSVNTIYDQNSELLELMVVLHDITDLITAQQEIQDTQKDVVYTMGAIGETRSKETGNHVKRVAEYSKLFAIEYGLSEDETELLKMASPMHDIGKVGIPDNILNKPGKLTNDEFKIMKSHSVLGYSMLKNSKREILKTASIVAYTHHEKWNGDGYPKGLSGNSIHIYGRITAIADVFDALGSDRCYKKAWEDEKIFKLIKDEKAKHFDPTLVDIFFNNLDKFLKIRETFKD